jgi:hypothetical protein
MDIIDGELAPREIRIRWRNLLSIPRRRIDYRQEIITMNFICIFTFSFSRRNKLRATLWDVLAGWSSSDL